MKAVITLRGKDLIELLQEKYRDADIQYVWLDLKETREYWESKNRKQLELETDLKQIALRVFPDGSFQAPEDTSTKQL